MDILGLLPLLLIVVVFYFFMIKPAKNRQRQAMETQNSLRPGMEVRTIAGLYATVSEVEDDSVILEVAPDVHCRFIKSAIAAVLSTENAEPETDGHDDADHDNDDDDDVTTADGTGTGDGAVKFDKRLDGPGTEDASVPDGDRLRKQDKKD